MKRLLATFGTALAGTTAGYVLHQTMAMKKAQASDQQPQALIIGAPLATAGLAAVVGLIGGKRSRLLAFVAGFAAAATLGDKIDDMIPGWPGSKNQLLDPIGKGDGAADKASGSSSDVDLVALVEPETEGVLDAGAVSPSED